MPDQRQQASRKIARQASGEYLPEFIRKLKQSCRRIFPGLFLPSDHKNRKDYWEKEWSQPGYSPKWLGRGVSKEIIAAVEEGWFPAGARSLDIGCGKGVVDSWLVKRGFIADGIDISATVIEQARAAYLDTKKHLRFMVLDICFQKPSGGPYSVLIDRGCLHQIPQHLYSNYIDNVTAVSSPDARMLLFIKAYRGQLQFGDAAERAKQIQRIENIFKGVFTLERSADTYLDPFDGTRPDQILPGMVFWLRRNQSSS